MKYLSQGLECKRKVDLLLGLTNITSDGIVAALTDHLVRNFKQSHAASINGIKSSHLSDALKVLNGVAEKVEKINELKYRVNSV